MSYSERVACLAVTCPLCCADAGQPCAEDLSEYNEGIVVVPHDERRAAFRDVIADARQDYRRAGVSP
jgi:hypothetical protein